jgi:hypothetical protein
MRIGIAVSSVLPLSAEGSVSGSVALTVLVDVFM